MKNSIQKSLLILILFSLNVFAQTTNETPQQEENTLEDPTDSGTRIWGLGYGVFIILIACALSFIICLLSGATPQPEKISLAGVFLPLIFIGYFAASSKEADKPQDDLENFEEDTIGPYKITIQVLIYVGGILCLYLLFSVKIVSEHETRKPANWYRDRDDLILQKQKEMERERKMDILYPQGIRQEARGPEKESIQKQDWTKGQNMNIKPEQMDIDLSRKSHLQFMDKEKEERMRERKQ